MKTPEVLLAENVLTWLVLNSIEYVPIDGESTKCLVSFDDIDRGEGRSEKPIYRRIVNNALKVLAQHAPESPTYIRAKEVWETLPIYTSYNIQIMPPKST